MRVPGPARPVGAAPAITPVRPAPPSAPAAPSAPGAPSAPALGEPERDHSPVRLAQLLTPDGRRHDDVHSQFVEDVTDADLTGLLRDMMIVRRFDAEATALQRQGELGLWASLLGQEAAQVGSARALADTDMVFPSYREHGVAWCRGLDPVDILALFRGVNHGGWDPTEHHFQLYSIVVGSQALHATGYAMGAAIGRGAAGPGAPGAPAAPGEATIVYFGDGASSEGDVNEAFGWASVFGAPLVFFCQNNQWAISEPAERQSRVPLFERARGFGFPSVRVDGNDVLATMAVTRWALAEARAGRGPVLVEALTYRMGAHTTADDPTRYRDPGELEAWRLRDPVNRLAAYLTVRRAVNAERLAVFAAEADAVAADTRRRCLALPDPPPERIFDGVLAGETDLLRGQRAMLRRLLGGPDAPVPTAAGVPAAPSVPAAVRRAI